MTVRTSATYSSSLPPPAAAVSCPADPNCQKVGPAYARSQLCLPLGQDATAGPRSDQRGLRDDTLSCKHECRSQTRRGATSKLRRVHQQAGGRQAKKVQGTLAWAVSPAAKPPPRAPPPALREVKASGMSLSGTCTQSQSSAAALHSRSRPAALRPTRTAPPVVASIFPEQSSSYNGDQAGLGRRPHPPRTPGLLVHIEPAG